VNDFITDDFNIQDYVNNLNTDNKINFLTSADFIKMQPIYRGSNYVYLTILQNNLNEQLLGVYKPIDGLIGLFDFDVSTLPHREVAAFEIDQLLQWSIVPSIVIRDGPMGIGSLQEFVPHDSSKNYFHFVENEDNKEQLMKIAIFDLLINNADRKGGHIIQDMSGNLWGIDNALTFHSEKKLRTVIWDYSTQKIEKNIIDDLVDLQKSLNHNELKFSNLLTEQEIHALNERCDEIITTRVLPSMYPWRCWPWPLI
jgi:uncharacterized repeat protein (TIGR03843 family)